MDLVECLGVEGTLGVIPLRENPLSAGWGASVEMIGLVDFPDFAAPIFGCWCGHTCHWCNRQH